MEADALRSSATESCRLSPTTETLGTMASAATFSVKVMARVSSSISSSSRRPSSPEDRIISSSSSIDRTPASSSLGSIPSFRTVQFADSLRKTISGLSSLLTICGMANQTPEK